MVYEMTDEEVAAKLKEIKDERVEMRARRGAFLKAKADKEASGS